MGEALHYHLWVRAGRVFTLRPTRYASRSAANMAGRRAGLPADRRMVRACVACPKSRRSKAPGRQRRVDTYAAAQLGVTLRALRLALNGAADRVWREDRGG